MGRAILPCGRMARNPYCFENLRIRVFTVEELCYVLKENAFLLDSSFADKQLISWIQGECNLEELAGILRQLSDSKAALKDFVMAILEYVGLYDTAVLEETEKLLGQGENLNSYEKEKCRIDALLLQGKYARAAKEYELLLGELPEVENLLSAKVLNNRGVAFARMFRFSGAADCFYRSFEMYPVRETFLRYLSAKRMQLTDREYVDFGAKLPDAYEDLLLLEQRVEALRKSWPQQERCRQLDMLQNGQTLEVGNMVQELKHQYRQENEEIKGEG